MDLTNWAELLYSNDYTNTELALTLYDSMEDYEKEQAIDAFLNLKIDELYQKIHPDRVMVAYSLEFEYIQLYLRAYELLDGSIPYYILDYTPINVIGVDYRNRLTGKIPLSIESKPALSFKDFTLKTDPLTIDNFKSFFKPIIK